jgi:hypothetical protein
MSYVWNPWIGFSKPLMDFRNDGPMPSPPDDPPAGESFWHSCATPPPATGLMAFDLTANVRPPEFTVAEVEARQLDAEAMVVPSWYDDLVAVEADEFDATN